MHDSSPPLHLLVVDDHTVVPVGLVQAVIAGQVHLRNVGGQRFS